MKAKLIVDLAADSLSYFLEHKAIMPVPRNLPEELTEQAGVFVSLKKAGELRGCIGTFAPTRDNIASEIIYNAVSAGTQDPRFWPVDQTELPELDISVDILAAPEPIDSLAELDPQKYGVIVEKGSRRGLLLPMLEGVDTAEEQVRIAKAKAGISPKEEAMLYRFTVTRYH